MLSRLFGWIVAGSVDRCRIGSLKAYGEKQAFEKPRFGMHESPRLGTKLQQRRRVQVRCDDKTWAPAVAISLLPSVFRPIGAPTAGVFKRGSSNGTSQVA